LGPVERNVDLVYRLLVAVNRPNLHFEMALGPVDRNVDLVYRLLVAVNRPNLHFEMALGPVDRNVDLVYRLLVAVNRPNLHFEMACILLMAELKHPGNMVRACCIGFRESHWMSVTCTALQEICTASQPGLLDWHSQ
jgi:hypothetical protein